jgi:hypothetical protein
VVQSKGQRCCARYPQLPPRKRENPFAWVRCVQKLALWTKNGLLYRVWKVAVLFQEFDFVSGSWLRPRQAPSRTPCSRFGLFG